MAKNNIITATKELVKELKRDVPEGETPPAHNGVIHTSLWGEGAQGSSHVIQAPLSPETREDNLQGAQSQLAADDQSLTNCATPVRLKPKCSVTINQELLR